MVEKAVMYLQGMEMGWTQIMTSAGIDSSRA